MRYLTSLTSPQGYASWLQLEAGVALIAIRTGLTVLSVRRTRRILAFLARWRPPGSDAGTPERIGLAVKMAAVRLPGIYSCLVRALAAQLLLERRGFITELQIGFLRSAEGLVEGHAWLRCNERIVIGDDLDLGQFTPFPSLPVRGERA